MRQVAARVKHPCFGVRVASVHKINRLHLENVACRGEKLFFEKTVFKTFCGEKDDKYMKTPHFRAVFSVLHLSSTHFVMPYHCRFLNPRFKNTMCKSEFFVLF